MVRNEREFFAVLFLSRGLQPARLLGVRWYSNVGGLCTRVQEVLEPL